MTSTSPEKMTDLERTILTMQRSHICADPAHCHSWQTVNFMLTAMRKCVACETRVQSVLYASSDSSKQIVKCVACGVYAHRTCSVSRHSRWKEPCPVNKQRIDEALSASQHQSKKQASFGDQSENDTSTSGELVVGHLSLDSSCSWNEEDGEKKIDSVVAVEKDEEPPLMMEWTAEGPPRHWAENIDPATLVSTITIPTALENSNDPDNDDGDDDEVQITTLHHADHPFASVSRALQENILAHFRRPKKEEGTETKEEMEQEMEQEYESEFVVSDALAVKAKRSEEEESKEPGTLAKLASGTLEVVRTTVAMPRRLGYATVAGGIAGGFAGLAMAGPAGAYAGYRLGQTAGVLGVILEGSVSIGVVVASVATASLTAKQIQDHMEERRVLTMGEEGTARKVLLVRPNTTVDPAWGAICAEAKRSAPKQSGSKFFFLTDDTSASRERYARDSDILISSEEEIPTPDKVLLLASRILNDKSSVPGHVYRSLIETFKERCSKPLAETEDGPSRKRRDDAHAVIKHVTATLLEERPGFGRTPVLTELTATAVEGFVFGRVYGLVFEEIQQEVAQKDADLTEKIASFERTEPGYAEMANQISEDALDSLRMLPKSHTAVEKLSSCTSFLERISEHFSKTGGDSSFLCADSLLKMVCQHILVANLESINAEVAFLEEFARDEQLLRGREGYALVTLQASLHFLNISTDLENGIFEQENDEKNVPVQPPPSAKSGLSESSGELL